MVIDHRNGLLESIAPLGSLKIMITKLFIAHACTIYIDIANYIIFAIVLSTIIVLYQPRYRSIRT